ncbi:hypothetical protein [Paenibacillus mesophilus]|uniref:hypothetical protein n=1 Tax=Paenibacillus mesophilus TaxID=2582849 RepID=UPI00130509EE|nr:hypothetical protein [Paenibacillus mesophilus]
MNKGQQVAKIQEYAEAKIAIQAVEDKQAYASSRVMEDEGVAEKTTNQGQPKKGYDKL